MRRFGDDRTGARITARGVDGVEFGDSPSDVVSKLGQYDAWGIAHARDRAWHIYWYIDGPHAGLNIHLLEVPGTDEDGDSTMIAGPVDFFVVYDGYTGTTREGIGVGSSREDLVRAYGEPPDVHGSNFLYCIDGQAVDAVVKGDSVAALHMGYYLQPKNVRECD